MKFMFFGAVALVWCATTANAGTATRAPFGALSDGTKVEAVTLTNGAGVSARIMTLGATLQSLIVPDKAGHKDDVVLGYDTAQEYLSHPDYFGASVGRYANRIAKGKFTLDGKSYMLVINDGPNSLHGGLKGFDKRMWKIDSVSSGPEAKVVLSYVSADGEEGFPGELKVTTTYSLNEQDELTLEYRATTSKPTVLNLTNHSYFNLSGNDARDVMGDMVTLHAGRFTPVDATLIPTGERRAVAGTVFDFRTPHRVGDRIRDARDQQIRYGRGYDHNFIVDGAAGTLRPAAVVTEPVSAARWNSAPPRQAFSSIPAISWTAPSSARAAAPIVRVMRSAWSPACFPIRPITPTFPPRASTLARPTSTPSSTSSAQSSSVHCHHCHGFGRHIE